MLNEEFHNVFYEWLVKYNMRAAEFARRYGCSREMIRQWLSGRVRNPYESTIEKICKVLEITVEEFWAGPLLNFERKPVIAKKKYLKKRQTKNILTGKQEKILDFIKSFMQERGYPPTLREMGAECGISSTNGVSIVLEALEKKKDIIRRPWLSRGIKLVNAPIKNTESKTIHIPIIEKVTPGEQIFSAENIVGMLAINISFFQSQKAFAYKSRDDSMSEVGIITGDYVIAQSCHTAKKGDFAVLIVGDEIMVRRYDERGAKVLLIPENEAYETMTKSVNSSDLQIVGKVIGLMRRYMESKE